MTMVVTWPQDSARRGLARNRLLRRLVTYQRLWVWRLARRRFVSRVLAETLDPELLADIGIRAARPSPVERWIATMLHHQR